MPPYKNALHVPTNDIKQGSYMCAGTGRIARFELVPLEELQPAGRPRVDALCNMSGIFRDSFQNVVELLEDLFKRASQAAEPEDRNFVRWVPWGMCLPLACYGALEWRACSLGRAAAAGGNAVGLGREKSGRGSQHAHGSAQGAACRVSQCT